MKRRNIRWKLFIILLICLAPVCAAFFAYYVWQPHGRTNYGSLIEPQRPLPSNTQLKVTHLDGRGFDLHTLRGHWIILHPDFGECDQACYEILFAMRQIRLMTGKNSDRVERVWLILDQTPIATQLMRQYDGMWMLRANQDELAKFLPTDMEHHTRLQDHIWLIDPLGNLMMRYPKSADPKKIYNDLSKLLYTTQGWIMKNDNSENKLNPSH